MTENRPGTGLSLTQKLRGHYRTLQPFLARSLNPIARPKTERWAHEFDSDIGPVQLSGRFLPGSPDHLVVVIHGLGGITDSGYMALALAEAERRDHSCLLLNCRGADRLGADLYHSGLTRDIAEVLNSPRLATYTTVDIFGYSIGGHIALKYCCGDLDARVRRVAAVGSPLDLRAAADDFDTAPFNVYRGHVLDALKEIYTAAYQRNPGGLTPLEARKIRTIRSWDDRIIAPRFGFDGADDYYEKMSVGPELTRLNVDALYVGASCDPMVLARSVRPYLGVSRLRHEWDPRGGHLGFDPKFDMGTGADLGLEPQVFSWFGEG